MQKAQIIQLLKWYKDAGVDYVINPNTHEIYKKEVSQHINEVIKMSKNETIVQNDLISLKDIISNAKEIVEKCSNIEDLRAELLKWDGCNLKKTASNTVFSDGNINSDIMIIGEAPGANEDIQGIPFCGDSGKLLDNMLSFIGLNRKENIYITNAIFWRPPGNRKPTNEEIAVCKPWLEKHIALFNPRLIILAGSTAVSAVLSINDAMSKIRQKFYDYSNSYITKQIPTIAIFHPSYLLRQPSQKKNTWNDLLTIKHYLNKNE